MATLAQENGLESPVSFPEIPADRIIRWNCDEIGPQDLRALFDAVSNEPIGRDFRE